jgi:O-antigen/teichoic acid export membrane protein
MKLRTQVALTTFSKTTKHLGVFILSIVLARYFSTAEYGTYLQVQLVATTTIYLSIFGVPHSIYYFLPKTNDRKRFARNTGLLMLTLAALSTWIIYLSMGLLGSSLNNPLLTDFALIVCGFIFFQIPIKMFEPLSIASKNVKTFVIVNLTFNLSFFFAVLIPVVFGQPLSVILYWLLVFFSIQFFVILMVSARMIHKLEINTEISLDIKLKEQIKYSAPIGFSGMIGEIARQTDKIIVSSYFTPDQFAIYARGAMEIPVINVIANSMNNILMPNFVGFYDSKDTQGLLEQWHSSIRVMALIVYPGFVFFVCTADILIPLLFSDKYIDSIIIFQVYTFALITKVTTYDAIVRAAGKTRVLLKLALASIVLNISLTILLIESIGIVGAPFATVITMFVVRFLYLKTTSDLLSIMISDVFPWKSLAHIILIALISFLPIILVRNLDYHSAILLILMSVFYAPLYFFLIKRFKVLNNKEKGALRGVLPKRAHIFI